MGGSPLFGELKRRKEENKIPLRSNREKSEATIIKTKAGHVFHQYGLFIEVLEQTPISWFSLILIVNEIQGERC